MLLKGRHPAIQTTRPSKPPGHLLAATDERAALMSELQTAIEAARRDLAAREDGQLIRGRRQAVLRALGDRAGTGASGGTPRDDASDPEQRRQFWTWWLDRAGEAQD